MTKKKKKRLTNPVLNENNVKVLLSNYCRHCAVIKRLFFMNVREQEDSFFL